jgi:hypothetical protein
MIAVYDHPPLLRLALDEAARRLIIISSWITDAVVDKVFLQKLGAYAAVYNIFNTERHLISRHIPHLPSGCSCCLGRCYFQRVSPSRSALARF